jgi:hypothetical protein
MAIKYIQYTKQQRSNTKVTGYTIYVNEVLRYICESMHEASKEAKSYSRLNDIEIYQILARS